MIIEVRTSAEKGAREPDIPFRMVLSTKGSNPIFALYVGEDGEDGKDDWFLAVDELGFVQELYWACRAALASYGIRPLD